MYTRAHEKKNHHQHTSCEQTVLTHVYHEIVQNVCATLKEIDPFEIKCCARRARYDRKENPDFPQCKSMNKSSQTL